MANQKKIDPKGLPSLDDFLTNLEDAGKKNPPRWDEYKDLLDLCRAQKAALESAKNLINALYAKQALKDMQIMLLREGKKK